MGRWVARLGGLPVLLALAATPAQAAQTPPVGTILTLGGPPLALYGVDPGTGQRTVLSDLGSASEGPTVSTYRVAAGAGGMVVATGLSTAAGAQDEGVLVRIDPATGERTLISDFTNPAQGPIGYTPFGVAVESSNTFLVTDRGQGGGGNGAALWRVSAGGTRTKLSDFNNPAQGPLGGSPEGVALDGDGHIYVADAEAGSQCNLPTATDFCGGLFRVDETTGQRTLVSDFGNPTQGSTGEDPVGLAFDPATSTFLVIDEFAGSCGCGELFRVDPANGARTLLSDFGAAGQGPTGGARPNAVAVAADGTILTDGCPGASGHGAICRIDPTTGNRVNFGDFGDSGLGSVASGPVGGLAFMGVVPQRRPTSTAVSCAPGRLSAGGTTSCTVTVSDAGSGSPTTPVGSVSFSSSAVDAPPFGFASGSCNLVASATPGVATCTALYRPQSSGSPTISVSFPGDSDHLPSTGSEPIEVPGGIPTPVVTPHPTVFLTSFTSGPSGFTAAAPTFTFIAHDPDATFECRFDSAPYTACATPLTTYGLSLGAHRFYVRSVSPAGVADPHPASRAFTLGTLTQHGSCSRFVPWDPYPTVYRPTVAGCLTGTWNCPAGSVCQMVHSGGIADADENVPYFAALNLETPGPFLGTRPTNDVCQNADADPFSNVTRARCPVTEVATLVGPTGVSGECEGGPVLHPTGGPSPVRGPDEQRVVSCASTFTISPASSLTVATLTGNEVVVTVPGQGNLFIGALGGVKAAQAAAAAPKQRKKPAPSIAPVHRHVTRAGPVRVSLRLSAAATRTLRRHRRLTLHLTVRFTPRAGRRVVRSRTITLISRACRPPHLRRGRLVISPGCR